jgi:hypothetical protein
VQINNGRDETIVIKRAHWIARSAQVNFLACLACKRTDTD